MANEIEILQGSATQKVKQLNKSHLNYNQSKAELEALRNDKSKMVENQNSIEHSLSSRKLEISQLNMMVYLKSIMGIEFWNLSTHDIGTK